MKRRRSLGLLWIFVATALAACSPSRLAEAVRVLADIEAGAGPSDLKEATGTPERRSLSIAIDDREIRADLYTPAETVRAGMVLVPGAAPGGTADPRLVAFANTLARARFQVLVPDIPGFRSLRVSATDSGIIADAVHHLRQLGPDRSLGVTAISFAAGPAVLALLEPTQANTVDFVVTIGGYYDIEAVVTFFTTGFYKDPGTTDWQYRQPNTYGKWVFVLSNTPRVESDTDRRLLDEMARRKLADPEASVEDLATRLGNEGRAIFELLNNRDPENVPALIDRLPKPIHDEIEALDLKTRALSRVSTRFILVHGGGDPIIPERESEAFAAALADGQSQLFVVDGFQHVDPSSPGFWGALTILRAVYAVLSLRDEENAG